jgi:hypothetical protein
LIRVAKEISTGLALTRSAEVEPGEIKELTKLVVYPGQLLLDGEFDSPPSPPVISGAGF